jgi:acyl carrier protein
MEKITEQEALKDMITIIDDLTDDWEYSQEITADTTLFAELGFESIDVVALGTAIEEYYGQSLPFAETMAEMAERVERGELDQPRDIRVIDLVNFVRNHLDVSKLAPIPAPTIERVAAVQMA